MRRNNFPPNFKRHAPGLVAAAVGGTQHQLHAPPIRQSQHNTVAQYPHVVLYRLLQERERERGGMTLKSHQVPHISRPSP